MAPSTIDALDLYERLGSWLSCFSSGTAQWGTISDVRLDGSVYQRHGVILELVVYLMDDASTLGSTSELREAIDLVKLALAVQPAAIIQLVKKTQPRRDDDEDALLAMAHGIAPVELRLRLTFKSIETENLKPMLQYLFTKLRDPGHHKPPNKSIATLRDQLIHAAHRGPRDLPGSQSSSMRRVRYIPVSVVLAIAPFGSWRDPLSSQVFFDDLTNLTKCLQSCQNGQHDVPWATATLHAPLVLHRIELSRVPDWITPQVVRSAQRFVSTGIPVTSMELNLDLRRITCDEADLLAYIQAIAIQNSISSSPPLRVTTGFIRCRDTIVDSDEQDHRKRLRMLLRTVAKLDNRALVVHLGGMLALCETARNREAILSGFVEDLLPRAAPTSVHFDCFSLLKRDTAWLRHCADQWHRTNPNKPLRLTSLCVWFGKSRSDPGRALVALLDDIEELIVYNRVVSPLLTADDVAMTLRFPGLRRLTLEGVCLPSMDIFDPSIPDARMPGGKPPALEHLEINGLTLDDPTGLCRFLQLLDPNAQPPSPLSQTLQQLIIAEDDPDLDANTLDDRDAAHVVTTVKVLLNVLKSNRVLRNVNLMGDFEDPSLRVDGWTGGSARHHHLPAPLPERRSAIAKARNVAFLSVVQGGGACGVACSLGCGQLDACIVRSILDYSAPHVYCRVCIDEEVDEQL